MLIIFAYLMTYVVCDEVVVVNDDLPVEIEYNYYMLIAFAYLMAYVVGDKVVAVNDDVQM